MWKCKLKIYFFENKITSMLRDYVVLFCDSFYQFLLHGPHAWGNIHHHTIIITIIVTANGKSSLMPNTLWTQLQLCLILVIPVCQNQECCQQSATTEAIWWEGHARAWRNSRRLLAGVESYSKESEHFKNIEKDKRNHEYRRCSELSSA